MASTVSVHVDRYRELASFREMLGRETGIHILLLQAVSGMGKSSLLNEFATQCSQIPFSKVDLKATRYTPEAVIDELAFALGRARFQTYVQRVREYTQSGAITITDTRVEDHSSIGITQGANAELLEQRRRVLTNDFLDDLAVSNVGEDTYVLMFDSYEATNPDVQAWLSNTFLPRARGFPWLVLVIAGQQIPPIQRDYEEWFLSHEMEPLDCDSIREYAQRKGVELTEDQFDLLCTSEARPVLVELWVDAYARKRSQAGPH
jgi:hypothetical protein